MEKLFRHPHSLFFTNSVTFQDIICHFFPTFCISCLNQSGALLNHRVIRKILILLMAMYGGFGGYGYGGYGNNGREATATQADIQRGFDTQAVISKLDGISNGLCDGFYAVNNGMLTGFNGIQMNMMQGNFGLQQAINANNIAAMQNANALQTQLADCCCQNKQGQAQIMYNMATDTCAITTALNNQTQAIMQNDNNNYRALHDEMVANRMADKDEIIAQLRTQLNQCALAASQQAQNQYLISQLRPSANPAYLVDNPFRSTGNLPCQQPTCCNG